MRRIGRTGYLTPGTPADAAPPCADARPISCARPAASVPDDGVQRHLPDSAANFTRNQAYLDYGPGDWYPGDHPAMPDIVAHGREKEGVRACSLCHYPNGQGKMENGGVAGLPADYILQQLADFKNGARKSADPRKANTNEMIGIAKALTDMDAKAAADYFASMTWRPWTKVVESDTAPKVRSTTNGLFIPLEGGVTEPLGQRIIEVPVNPERTEIQRDPRSGFVAFVPPGSIAKGEVLVTTGGGKTMACGICHGENLKGRENTPGIAGRSTSYLVRQLYDMQKGTRNGPGAALMGAAVANLSEADMIAIAAYVASRPVN